MARQPLKGSPRDHVIRVLQEAVEATSEEYQSKEQQCSGLRAQLIAAEGEREQLRADYDDLIGALKGLQGPATAGNGQDSVPAHEPSTPRVVSLEAGDEWVIEVEEAPEEPHAVPVEESAAVEEPKPPEAA